MLRLFILFLALIALPYCLSSQDGQPVEDILFLMDGKEVRGQILELKHGKFVRLVRADGEVINFDWPKIKRIGYYELRRRDVDYQTEEENGFPVDTTASPTRPWLHRVGVSGLFGVQASQFISDTRIIGAGLNYYLLRRLGKLKYGGGLDYALMHFDRRERTAALMGTAEYALFGRPGRRWRFLTRLNVGAAYPLIPTNEGTIETRKLGLLTEPSLGLELVTGDHDYHNVHVTVGYRILDSSFTVTTPTLDLVERRVAYRRVMVCAGYTF